MYWSPSQSLFQLTSSNNCDQSCDQVIMSAYGLKMKPCMISISSWQHRGVCGLGI